MVRNFGPVFNGVSCSACHSQPAIGGGLFINEVRVRNNPSPVTGSYLRGGTCCGGSAENTAIFGTGLIAGPG